MLLTATHHLTFQTTEIAAVPQGSLGGQTFVSLDGKFDCYGFEEWSGGPLRIPPVGTIYEIRGGEAWGDPVFTLTRATVKIYEPDARHTGWPIVVVSPMPDPRDRLTALYVGEERQPETCFLALHQVAPFWWLATTRIEPARALALAANAGLITSGMKDALKQWALHGADRETPLPDSWYAALEVARLARVVVSLQHMQRAAIGACGHAKAISSEVAYATKWIRDAREVAPEETVELEAASTEAEKLAHRINEIRGRIAERLDVAERARIDAAAARRALKVRPPRKVPKVDLSDRTDDDDLV